MSASDELQEDLWGRTKPRFKRGGAEFNTHANRQALELGKRKGRISPNHGMLGTTLVWINKDHQASET